MRYLGIVATIAVCLAVTATAQAITIDLVTVGNPGNTGEPSGTGSVGGVGTARICGAMGYEYQIGKYEVTAGQYTAFLNAVAATDTYGLYNAFMANTTTSYKGCNIVQGGGPGSYSYSVASDWANRPVNYVSWGDATRFANWLHNGQPTGAQGLTTTEDGAYFLNGAMSSVELIAVTRKADWKWAITSEDEWYKAAYYDPTLNGGAGGYWDYPTTSNTQPGWDYEPDASGNNANYKITGSKMNGPGWFGVLGSPYYRTVAGEFQNSDSPYGTFDQAGNVQEWTEAIPYYDDPTYVGDEFRGMEGAYFGLGPNPMLAAYRAEYMAPQYENSVTGFRVVAIPEPVTMAGLMLGIGSVVGYIRRRRLA